MWRIYDDLIAAVPEDLKVSECILGLHWTLIRSRWMGLALTPFERGRLAHGSGGSATSTIGERITGMPVRRLAEYVKSWNPYEAALGMAAINSALNSPQQIEQLSGVPLSEQPQASAFAHYADLVRNRSVAVIGHFPDLDEFAKVCRLTILERNPGPGDLPDPACEYVLPEQEFVFITATALINKTFPRLLELSRNARTFLVGPTTPFAPALFGHGIDTLAGTVVIDPDELRRAVLEGATFGIFGRGARMVKVARRDASQTVVGG